MAKKKWSHDEIEEYKKTHNQFMFYYNKDDTNLFVSKSSGLGLTLNFANPLSFVLIIIILALVLLLFFGKYL